MKLLQEISVLEDGKILLKSGFYLEPATNVPSFDSNGHRQWSWDVKRLMSDDVTAAEVSVTHVCYPSENDYKFFFTTTSIGVSIRFRAPSHKMMLDSFYGWVQHKLLELFVNEDLFADARKARQAKSLLDKPVYMRRLNKDGSESGLRDATTFHGTEEEAKAHHDRLVQNNPGSKIVHHMYSYNGEETFKTKFVNGKLVPLKGGITNNSDIRDAVHDFIQMLDDEGSSAGMWMPYAKKEELYKLYKAKHKIKSAGVNTEGMEEDVVTKKIRKLEAKGWKLFASEWTSVDYIDMVFTKAP